MSVLLTICCLENIALLVSHITISHSIYVINDVTQNHSILGHPKTKAFVTHGGANGVFEAIYHGVPMVGLPLFADQPDNIIYMKAKGAAVKLDWKTMSSAELLSALKTVINDPS